MGLIVAKGLQSNVEQGYVVIEDELNCKPTKTGENIIGTTMMVPMMR